MLDTFEHVTTCSNLRSFLREEADEYGDGVAELLSFARRELDDAEARMTEAEFLVRHEHLLEAEDAWNLDDDIDGVRESLQAAFSSWPAPLAQAA